MKQKTQKPKSNIVVMAIAFAIFLFTYTIPQLAIAVQPDETFVWIMGTERRPTILTKLTSGGNML